MTKTVVDDYQQISMHFIGSNNTLIVAASGVIENTNGFPAVYSDSGTENNDISVSGVLKADQNAIETYSSNSTIEVAASGMLVGTVYIAGSNIDVTNKGTIIATTGIGGINLSSEADGATISNYGLISSGDMAIACISAATIKNQHGGRLIGHEFGIELFTGGQKIINHGLIQGQEEGIWSKYGGDAHIVNDGSIKGGIELGNGNDTLDTRGGTVLGTIEMEFGDDTLVTDNAKLKLTENPGEGNDTVKSTVSYTLSDSVERLILVSIPRQSRGL